MTEYSALQLGPKARQQLRSLRGARTRISSQFSQGGIPKPHPAPPPAITLRRADYETQRGNR